MKRKSNSVVTVQQDGDAVLVFDVLGAGTLRFDTSRVFAGHTQRAAMHGWKQRISDAAALGRDRETGASASPAEKYEAMRALIDHYESGAEEWNRTGTGGGLGSITIEAIARVKGCTYAEAEAMVDGFAAKRGADRKDILAELRTGERVAKAILAIRAERMPATKADSDELLDEMMGE